MADPDPTQGHWIAVRSYLLPYCVDVHGLSAHLLEARESLVLLETSGVATLQFSILTVDRAKAITVLLNHAGLASFSHASKPANYNALLRSIHDCIPARFRQYQMQPMSLLTRKIMIGFFKDEKRNKERLERLASAGIDINSVPLLP